MCQNLSYKPKISSWKAINLILFFIASVSTGTIVHSSVNSSKSQIQQVSDGQNDSKIVTTAQADKDFFDSAAIIASTPAIKDVLTAASPTSEIPSKRPAAQAPLLTEPVLFYNANSPNIAFQEPIIDSQGNLIVISSHTNSFCTPNTSCLRLNSISPNGNLNWQTPSGGYIAPSSRYWMPVLGPNDSIYVPTTESVLHAFNSNGSPIGGFPVALAPSGTNNWQFPPVPVLVDFNTGLIYASVRQTMSFDTFPNSIIALNPNGSEQWRIDYPNHARSSNAGNLFYGPEQDIYTFLFPSTFPNTTSRFTRLNKANGNIDCDMPTNTGSERAGGDERGIFTDYQTELQLFGSNCTSTTIYNRPDRSIEFRKYDQGIIYAIDYPVGPFDPNQIRLVAISSTGVELWRNPDIIPNGSVQPVRAVKNGIAYVLALDGSDNNKTKLFAVDSQTGVILSRVDTTSICGLGCGVAVSDNGNVYLSYADKIYKSLSPNISVSPSSGQQSSTTFVISGSGFTQNGNATLFLVDATGNQQEVGSTTSNSSGQFTTYFTISCNNVAGNYSFKVLDVASNVFSGSGDITITSSPGCGIPPVISRIDPPIVAVNQATSVTITGSGFKAFFSAEVTTPQGPVQIPFSNTNWDSANQVRVIVPAFTTSPYLSTLKITNPDQLFSSRTFQVGTAPPPPEITNLNPSTINANELTEVSVIGNNFPAATDFTAEVIANNEAIPILLSGRTFVNSQLVKLRFMVNSTANTTGILKIRDSFGRTTNKSFQVAFVQPIPPETPWKIKGIEVTQGIQDINSSYRQFVQGKPTFVRVHVKSTNGNVDDVQANLVIRRNGPVLRNITQDNSGRNGIKLLTDPNRSALDDSFLYRIPDEFLYGTLDLEFRGVSHQFSCEGNQNCITKQIQFTPMPVLEIRIVRIKWTGITGITHSPSNEEIVKVKDDLKAALPVADLQFSESNFTFTQNGRPSLLEIMSEIAEIRNSEGCYDSSSPRCTRYYIGILENAPPFQQDFLGNGIRPGYIAYAYLKYSFLQEVGFEYSFLHEIGHNFGRKHIKTTLFNDEERLSPIDNMFPDRPNGRISVDQSQNGFYGFNIKDKCIYSPSTFDIMGYSEPQWISSYTQTGIICTLNPSTCDPPDSSKAKTTPNSLTIPAGSPIFVINGLATSNPNIGEIYSLSSGITPSALVIPNTGAYSIRYENNGQTLAVYNFDLIEQSGFFNLTLPFNQSATRIVLVRDGIELAFRQASANAPTVTVTYPNGTEVLSGSTATLQWAAADSDGDALRYQIQYSANAGATWRTITPDWSSTSYELNLDSISGTSQGLIRVIANDGFHSTQDQSNNFFSVNTHVPQSIIFSPSNNSYFVGDQNIVLTGSGSDLEDGQLNDSSIIWSSNVNGSLGSGRDLTVNALDLTEGFHTITLTARDTSAQIGAASVNIQIFRTPPTIPTTLNTAPDNLSFIAEQGTTNLSQPQILSVRNDGEGTLNWSASANLPWIQLSETTGTAPSNAEVRINPSGLALGNYTGTITITTPDATNSPQTVNVSLIIVETLTPTGIVSGKVTYANALTTTSVPFTNLDAAGSLLLSTTTDSNGDYSLSGFAAGAYTITPSKTNQVNGISNLDASRVAQHIVGLTVLNANQLIAADTTGNGTIGSLDAAYIAQFVASIPNPGITGRWKFLPSSRSYPDIQSNQMNQDYSAILVGDVTGNWNPAGALLFDLSNWNPTKPLRFDLSAVESEPTRQAEKAAKEVVTVTAQRNQIAEEEMAMTLDLTATETTGEGILGYQFDLLYDAAVIEPQATSCDVSDTLSSGMTAMCQVSEPGVLKVVVFGAMPMTGSGTILKLNFKVVGARGSTSGLTIKNFMFNEDLPSAVTVRGQW